MFLKYRNTLSQKTSEYGRFCEKKAIAISELAIYWNIHMSKSSQ